MVAPLFIREKDGIKFQVKVVPNASKNHIGEIALDGNQKPYLKISVNCAPVDNKANKAVIALLAQTWKLKKTQITIKQGSLAKNKLIHITGDPDALLSRLPNFNNYLR